MYYQLTIPNKEGTHSWFALNFYASSKYERIEVKDVCIIDVYKAHDHRYDLKCFFYDKKYIYYQESIRSKKELHRIVQKLLKENL